MNSKFCCKYIPSMHLQHLYVGFLKMTLHVLVQLGCTNYYAPYSVYDITPICQSHCCVVDKPVITTRQYSTHMCVYIYQVIILHFTRYMYTQAHSICGRHTFFLICFHKFDGFFLTLFASTSKFTGNGCWHCLHVLQATGELLPQLVHVFKCDPNE